MSVWSPDEFATCASMTRLLTRFWYTVAEKRAREDIAGSEHAVRSGDPSEVRCELTSRRQEVLALGEFDDRTRCWISSDRHVFQPLGNLVQGRWFGATIRGMVRKRMARSRVTDQLRA